MFGGDGGDWIDVFASGAVTLVGGSGNDTLTGGAGADRFVFAMGFGEDRITDLSLRQDEVIAVSEYMLAGPNPGGAGSPAAFVERFGSVEGGNVALGFGCGDRIIVEGVGRLATVAAAIEIFSAHDRHRGSGQSAAPPP